MRRTAFVLAVAVVVTVTGCSAAAKSHSTQMSSAEASHSPTSAATAQAAPVADPPDPVAGMTLAQQVGQLFMVGTNVTALNPVTLDAISTLHVGNVFLCGRSHEGTAATAGVRR